MKLPNGQNAVVDLRKLTEYALNPDHPVGGHKARVFASVLGWTMRHARMVQSTMLEATRSEEAIDRGEDVHGHRYEIDFTVDGLEGPVTIVSAWIVRHGEDDPRLISCRVKRRR